MQQPQQDSNAMFRPPVAAVRILKRHKLLREKKGKRKVLREMRQQFKKHRQETYSKQRTVNMQGAASKKKRVVKK